MMRVEEGRKEKREINQTSLSAAALHHGGGGRVELTHRESEESGEDCCCWQVYDVSEVEVYDLACEEVGGARDEVEREGRGGGVG